MELKMYLFMFCTGPISLSVLCKVHIQSKKKNGTFTVIDLEADKLFTCSFGVSICDPAIVYKELKSQQLWLAFIWIIALSNLACLFFFFVLPPSCLLNPV